MKFINLNELNFYNLIIPIIKYLIYNIHDDKDYKTNYL